MIGPRVLICQPREVGEKLNKKAHYGACYVKSKSVDFFSSGQSYRVQECAEKIESDAWGCEGESASLQSPHEAVSSASASALSLSIEANC
jgi:hypothetical protein